MRIFFIIILTFVLFLSGCSVLSSENGVTSPSQFVQLNEVFEAKTSISKGETVALDLRTPKKSGYRLVGASFDPEMLTLVNYLLYEDDERERVQYVFEALADGVSDVLIKMEPVEGGPTEIFKQVTIHVGEDDSFF